MAAQQRPQISELQFEKITTRSTFSCWKIRFKTQVSACSGSSSEAMLWIKKVDGRFGGRFLNHRARFKVITHFSNFEMLHAGVASALNKIIQNFYFKKKVSLEEQKAQKGDRFLRGRQIAFMIYYYFRVTGAHDTVLDYADPFSHDDFQEFDKSWDEILCVDDQDPT